MSTAGWLVAIVVTSAFVIVLVVIRLRNARRTLDMILAEHRERMAGQQVISDSDAVPRYEQGRHAA